MANVAAPFGLRPVRHRNGAPYNGACRLYQSLGATALYIGDPVIILTAGANTATYFGSQIGSLPIIGIATAGTAAANKTTGAIVGFFPETAQAAPYGVNSAVRGVYVADDPDLVFEIMDDGLAALTYASVNKTGNFNSSTYSGSTITARSGWTMSTTISSATTDQLRIISVCEKANNATGKNAIWEVMLANHTFVPAALAAGI